MSLPQPNQIGYTLTDWAEWEGRWELIHGVPYDMTPAPSVEHQRVGSHLHAAICKALEEAGGGEVFFAPIALFMPGEQSVYQPDLVVVCDPAKVTPRGIEGVPDLVVEILDPGTLLRDLHHKRSAYEGAGVPEYLIVSPGEQLGVLLHRVEGRYAEAAPVAWGAVLGLLGGKVDLTLG